MPWLPADADETFDPLAHADIEIDTETPIAVTPRGGAREVGRSCYQVDTEFSTTLVDCGLNQGTGDSFPDFRGLEPGSIGAVFLTHAHIDHSGGLPILEARGLLADDAPIIATPPTIEIAKTLLEDSLKIHRRESRHAGEEQQYVESHVEDVFERFEPVEYGGGRVEALAPIPDEDPLVFQMGNAGHLLGSAWLMLQTNGYRTVFSGDLGGRAPHLPDITAPPQADLLVLESTYGSLHSHTAMSDAQSSLYDAAKRAVQSGEPVLIPTFAVGRAQMLMLLFANRLHTLSDDIQDRVQLVVDGMAQEAIDIYHEFATDASYMDESIVNRVESGTSKPFLPDGTAFPSSDSDRRAILTDAARSGGKVPIIIAPSGMLTGGNSPRYLTEFAARFGSANVFLTGYQAQNTTGRVLQDQRKAEKDELTYTVDSEPLGTDWPSVSNIVRTTVEEDGKSKPVTRATIPADWVSTINGLSGHAAQHGLLEFVRTVSPETVALIHGPEYAQGHLATHLAKNVESIQQATRSRMLTPIAVSRDIDVDTPALSPENFETADDLSAHEKIEVLQEQLSAMSEDLAAARNDTSPSEAEIRRIVRDEIENSHKTVTNS
ncbi:metal-dependent RNase [Halococcus salifodinae DSM 8989]|uniref:Metal-dependent RNase n=2 Tax=Halococcus salifodinae TaxID=36738 RepID=M0MSR5_9EURY|nr:metal-dependent RNase [Halococcus salifodinae DSM 8989]